MAKSIPHADLGYMDVAAGYAGAAKACPLAVP